MDSIQYPHNVEDIFKKLPIDVQDKTLKLIERVNKEHLHCEDSVLWERCHYLITAQFASYYHKKQTKHLKNTNATPQQPVNGQNNDDSLIKKAKAIGSLTQKGYDSLVDRVSKELNETFHDRLFVKPVIAALHEHILQPLHKNYRLVCLLCRWVILNATYLPLGTHLLPVYQKDMDLDSPTTFAKLYFEYGNIEVFPDALSQKTILQVKAFLSEVGQAHSRTCGQVAATKTDKPTAVILSIKHGPGGHVAPAMAMGKRLAERGWNIRVIDYDVELKFDLFQDYKITFEDGSPMTANLYLCRWQQQKYRVEEGRIIHYYLLARTNFNRQLIEDNDGGFLLRDIVAPLNPQLILTTLQYHWSWKALAFRVAGAKTLLASSDVFFHFQAHEPWMRQRDFFEHFRRIHFTAMTDDLELLRSVATCHDEYWVQKYPGIKHQLWTKLFSETVIDSQISVIDAPIHPSFKAISDPKEIDRLRKKWNVAPESMCVCISKGRLGASSDIEPAIESYRTKEILSQPLEIHVVCGENIHLYEELRNGKYRDLGPNITVIAHPLLSLEDFGELRAICKIDDIKAGGASTFEGRYLILKGSQTMMILTPGEKLWWEKANCLAIKKWGLGNMVDPGVSKIPIVMDLMKNGLPPIKQEFQDWVPLFDRCIDKLYPAKSHT